MILSPGTNCISLVDLFNCERRKVWIKEKVFIRKEPWVVISPSLRSQPSLSGLKKVCVRSLPSSSGILKGSFLILSYRFWCNNEDTEISSLNASSQSSFFHLHKQKTERTHPTLSNSSGRSPPSLMPRFIEIKRSTPGLSLTFGLWRLVFSIMMANDST